jgi:hypothetical protein
MRAQGVHRHRPLVLTDLAGRQAESHIIYRHLLNEFETMTFTPR